MNSSIGYIGKGGSFGGRMWRGEASIPVAIKSIAVGNKFPSGFAFDRFEEELNNVVNVLDKEYIVKQYGIRSNDSNIYQSMEIMDESLELFDIVHILNELHDRDKICKNLKPSNIFVQNGRAKLDPGAATSIQSFKPWLAPEERLKDDEKRLAQVEERGTCADMFRLGMLLYFCLTGGEVIFEKPEFSHSSSIIPKANYEAIPLIESLMSENFKERPSAKDVLRHPLFWPSQRRLEFLEISGEMCQAHEDFRRIVDEILPCWKSADDWTTIVDESFIRDMENYEGKKKGAKLMKPKGTPSSCLRLIQTLNDQLASMSDETEDILKGYASGMLSPDTYSVRMMYGLEKYFAVKFPQLLWLVWDALRESDYNDSEIMSCYF
ncbi:probable serine/threonine-protein kinase irla [Phtheirospermum japonicum]|uniref:Probable serine/threonine-protein kinase irla n=1 Tax=Phtheirospermum japonicum TaxID=374723 RepID=A0A830CEB9_9LAMI|nr:probable serine/threonine-protein kinase irla [Phtheirospermum japonicum]